MKKYFFFPFFVFFITNVQAQNTNYMNIFQFEQESHLVLAQYYRWYQVYEVPFTPERINNQKDILSEDVEIVSQNGTSKGKANLEERLKVFTGWLNAHHVQKTTIKPIDNESLSLEADILYQNIRPDGSKHSYTLHYSTVLQKREHDLPLFTKINLQPTGVVSEFKFEEAYTENRVKSFIHYWLYLMEQPNFEKSKELLAPHFNLQLGSTEQITNLETFEKWLNTIPQRIITSTHSYKNLKIIDNKDNTFSVAVDFDWKGISVKNEKMVAQTHHEWVLVNDMNERFARMKDMKVTVLKAFQVVDKF